MGTMTVIVKWQCQHKGVLNAWPQKISGGGTMTERFTSSNTKLGMCDQAMQASCYVCQCAKLTQHDNFGHKRHKMILVSGCAFRQLSHGCQDLIWLAGAADLQQYRCGHEQYAMSYKLRRRPISCGKACFLIFLGRLRPGGLYHVQPHMCQICCWVLCDRLAVLPGGFLIHVRILSGLTILLRPATALMIVNTAPLVPDMQNEN